MNKQELIKHFEEMEYVSISQMGKKAFIDLIEQLDEPQKVTVPQFVADWYEDCKENLEYNIWSYIYNWEQKEGSAFKDWIDTGRNKPIQTLVNMHQFGYTVEKEKRYLVRMKGLETDLCFLNCNTGENYWTFSDEEENNLYKTHHTRNELEGAGFGEVFNSPLFEVEEVE